MAHCYLEANGATVPEAFNVPSLVATVMEGRPPKLITLLREPAVRLWVAYWTYGQYPARYGPSEVGFSHYVGNQTAAYRQCVATDGRGRRRCVLRFEAYGAAEAGVYYHADQLLKGVYAAFLPEWQAALPLGHMLTLRTEDYLARPTRTLRRVVGFLGARPFLPDEAREASRLADADEYAAVVKRGHPLPADRAVLERVRGFYAPFNLALAALMHDDAFRWPDFERLYPGTAD